jgi:hypothetical protein
MVHPAPGEADFQIQHRPHMKGSSPFLKKRTKKLFSVCSCAFRMPVAQDASFQQRQERSFLLLFFKKEGLPS